jgi:hypothetical protein
MKKLLPICSAVLLAFPLLANAGPLEFNSSIPATGSVLGSLDWDGSADGGYRRVNVTTTSPSYKNYNGWGGQFQGYFSTDSLDESSNPGNLFFRFFCIDLFHYAEDAVTPYKASFYNNDMLSKLYDIAYPNKQLGDFYNGSTSTISGFGQFANGNGFTKQEYSAAFQLSVWELTYETGTTHKLDSGSFNDSFVSENAHKIADTWLAQVDAYSGNGYKNWQLYRFDSETNQDYVAARYVPEPGSMALFGVAMFSLLGMRRRVKAS